MINRDLDIEKHGKNAIISNPVACFSYQVEEIERDSPRNGNSDYFEWSQTYSFADGLELIPYGRYNDMPQLLRNTIYRNPNIPGVMEKKQQLLWGQGPHLYRTIYEDKKPQREWVEDSEIQSWLESFDHLTYLEKTIQDFNFMQGSFSKIVNAKSTRMGVNFIHSLEHINPLWARLARKDNAPEATHALISDSWKAFQPTGYRDYPLFDPLNPGKSPISVFYSKLYSFATDFYSIPTILGALEWINRDTAVPLILKALGKNSINAKYHVTSPSIFWDDKRKQIQEECLSKNIDYEESMLEEYERNLFKSIIQTLSGDESAGKIWHTKTLLSPDGANLIELGWTITPIDQNIKDFVETQIKIADKSASAVSAAVGIHKSLGGITDSGKSDSGSEQLYAYTMFKLIGVKIPEMIVTRAINHAIKTNFPKKNLQLGFYHEEAQRQEDQSSKNRLNNQPT
ncbi:Uncharacterised protein [Chryseobacterium nakagawai]|uniref:Uncharacterized protein n=1 Tax=Chryseobacterium nakagawai TaxID=1241982 RepID=A0AAD0YM57_CHRNA|nr:hypothetical protein [Chryseobacterium nakagawai]AZA93041.1 hypothetical protein EG343_21775 [Chryseobacterium nakagawai]VEH19674.1 Uncharacterised protein [Chryseobacterium nakagawai]